MKGTPQSHFWGVSIFVDCRGPPRGQIVIEEKKKSEKHKATLGKLLEEQ
jgi:hypothetical protein